NLYDRADFEADLRSTAQEHELGVVSYFSLASGFLTGKYKTLEDLEGKARGEFLKRYFDDRGKRVLEALLQVSDDVGARPAQVALAWLLNRPAVTAPIVSATTLPQLDEILQAVNVSLPHDAMARLDQASAG